MTKKELLHRISRDCRLTPSQATRALQSIAHNLSVGMGRGDRIQIAGLGSFAVSRLLSRQGRHPRTRHRIRLNRRRGVRFTPARALQRRLR